MKQICLITDYKGQFGTKFTAVPYRSGMNRKKLTEAFLSFGLEALFFSASEIHQEISDIRGRIFLYTSSEDRNESYKSFLEDVILSLEAAGGITIPSFVYLRAHNNKVFMELFKKSWGPGVSDMLPSRCFGTYEEMIRSEIKIKFPVVLKRPEGFKSRGVYLAHNREELKRICHRISRTRCLKSDLKDYLRTFIHNDFTKESLNRKKFIIQEYIPGLINDWKILIYGTKYYVLERKTRKNDFRASGSGLLSYPTALPGGLLDFAKRVYDHLNVPNLSLDLAFDGSNYNVLEFQVLYFGTYTIEHSEFYFSRDSEGWRRVSGRSELEMEYARSIDLYLKRNNLAE